VASVLIAAVGTGLIWLYVAGADQRAAQSAERKFGPLPAIPATPTPEPGSKHGLKQDFGITIEIQDPDRAAGLLVPDDLVTIFTAAKGDPTQIKQVVQNVRVISVGSKSSAEKNANESGLSSTILGLDVSVDDAEQIYRARAEGSLMVAVQGVPLVR
jgi:hypothetical protein